MPKNKQSAKSDPKTSPKSASKAKPGSKKFFGDQVDDPIIVKGGSISLSFDSHNFTDLTPAGTTARRFDHEFPTDAVLQRVKVFRAGSILFQTELQPADVVMICYNGSTCSNVAP